MDKFLRKLLEESLEFMEISLKEVQDYLKISGGIIREFINKYAGRNPKTLFKKFLSGFLEKNLGSSIDDILDPFPEENFRETSGKNG